MPKGRWLRRCDAVAVSLYSVEDKLLHALFKPRSPVAPKTESALSADALRGLGSVQSQVAASEGTGLTAEELELIQSIRDDSSESGTESGDNSDAEAQIRLDPKTNIIQANASSYRALIIENLVGGVGLGISSAFRSARECKARHAVLLLSAGHFAACIFDASGRVERHKTCKRYVVRGKGRSQGGHDKKGKARSIGAQMRREGEKKLAEDVHTAMLEWAGHLENCDVIFVSCPAARKSELFGLTLSADDPRVRRIPFAGIGKPNMASCIGVHSLLCSALFFRSWPTGVLRDQLPTFPENPVQVSGQVDDLGSESGQVELQNHQGQEPLVDEPETGNIEEASKGEAPAISKQRRQWPKRVKVKARQVHATEVNEDDWQVLGAALEANEQPWSPYLLNLLFALSLTTAMITFCSNSVRMRS